MLRSPSEERDHHSGNDKSEPDPKISSHGQSLSENSAFVTQISHQLCRSLTPINYSYRRPSILPAPQEHTRQSSPRPQWYGGLCIHRSRGAPRMPQATWMALEPCISPQQEQLTFTLLDHNLPRVRTSGS
jgi:hypothetical protein